MTHPGPTPGAPSVPAPTPVPAPPGAGAVRVYRIFLGVALVCLATALAFFLVGLADGSVSSFNLGLWLALLAGLGVVPWAGRALRARGRIGPAVAVLGLVAVPGLLAGLLMAMLLVTQPRWN